MRRVLATVWLVSALAACGGVEPERAGDEAPVPAAAVVTCRGDGAAVLPSRVLVQRDGIHFELADPDVERSFSVHTLSGAGVGRSMGGRWPHRLVVNLPPGRLLVRCAPEGEPTEVEARDPLGFWSSTDVRRGCPTGKIASTSGAYGAEPGVQPRGKPDDPVEMVRRRIGDRLEPGDVVERGGYRQSQDAEVRVLRGGRVVAVYRFFGDGHGGWLSSSFEVCMGMGLD